VAAVSTLLLAGLTLVLAPRYALEETEVLILRSAEGTQASRSTSTGDQAATGLREAVARALAVAATFSAALAGLLSWLASRGTTSGVRAVARSSRTIAAGGYDERLVTPRGGGEIADLVDSFNAMAGELEDMERTRRHLVTDVSHELKTPLASIRGYMEGLLDGMVEGGPGVYRLVYDEARRLERLADSLLALSRPEQGALALRPMRMPLGDAVGAVAAALVPQYRDKGVILSRDPGLEHVAVLADPDALTQVLTNLLGNAPQYTPAGGRVAVGARLRGDDALVSIEDTGVGLEAQHIERIFSRFFRVEASRSRAGGGSGIGLTVARGLVEAQGGRLWAESAGPGRGTPTAAIHGRLRVRLLPRSPSALGGALSAATRDSAGPCRGNHSTGA
jgi:histidine kinase